MDKDSVSELGEMRQGRNSNGAPRPTKYVLDLEDVEGILLDQLSFVK